MAAQYCVYCGRSLPPGSVFCPSCGGAIGGSSGYLPPLPGAAAAVGLPPGASSQGWGRGGYAAGAWASPDSLVSPEGVAAAQKALTHVRLAAVLGLAAAIIGIAVSVLLPMVTYSYVVQGSSGNSPVSVQLPWMSAIYVGLAAAFGLAQILLYWSGFRVLSEHSDEFVTPARLSLLVIVAWVILVGGLSLLLAALTQGLQCTVSSGLTGSSCNLGGTFLGGVALTALGALLVLIGYIGILLGVWRIGKRYNSTVLKVAAILLIIPVLSVVGDILVIVGTSEHIRGT